jgi:hypothetical protein
MARPPSKVADVSKDCFSYVGSISLTALLPNNRLRTSEVQYTAASDLLLTSIRFRFCVTFKECKFGVG